MNTKSFFLKNTRLLFLTVTLLFASFVTTQAQEDEGILNDIEKHGKAVHVLSENISNPSVQIGPDGYYYLTATVPTVNAEEPFVKLWRSADLANWETFDKVKHEKNSVFVKELKELAQKRKVAPQIYSPEAYYIGGRWVIVHSSNVLVANLMRSNSQDIKGPYTEPLGLFIGFQKDPSIFVDDDATPWLISNCTQIRKLKKNFSDFDGSHRLIGPIDRLLGFEGSRMIKIGSKYVLFGTSWSTDVYGKGTYNLYYATADNILGPYGTRKFAGRFIGDGAPFKDKKGRWWALATFNADQPTSKLTDLAEIDLSNSSYTINQMGLTLVPLSINEINGDVAVTSKDPDYQFPGKEEVQQF